MKKPFLFFLLFLSLGIEQGFTQSYIFEYDIDYSLHQSRRRWYHHFYFTTSAGETEIPEFMMHQDENGNRRVTGIKSLPVSGGAITKIRVTTGRQDYDFPYWDSDCSTATESVFFSDPSGNTGAFDLSGASLNWGCFPADRVRVYSLKMYPELSINSADNIMPDDDKIEVRASSGLFPVGVYNWEYGILRDSAYVGNPFSGYRWEYYYDWYAVPSHLYNKDALSASGRDLLGDNVENFYNKNIYIRLNFGAGFYSQQKTFTIRRIAPHILNVSYQKESCFNYNDAKIIVTFDRTLTSKERLYITFNNVIRESERVVVSSDNKAVISNVRAGTYNMGLYGVYERTAADTVNLYTDGSGHRADNFTVEGREPLSATMTPYAVHCKNGEDGKISLAVSGGESPYTAVLSAGENDMDEQPFSAAHTFENLATGTYGIRIRDANGCVNDASEQPLVRDITITEPADSVFIFIRDFAEATGYGRSTGWAEVGAQGGSGGYAFTWEKQTPPTDMTAASGTDTTSRLENLPANNYLALVKDQNYNLANPATEVNTRGCFDTISIFIDQPPKIIAVVRETHIVTCHGDDDGQLTVRVTGGRPFNPAQDTGRTLPYNYEWFKIENGADSPVGGNDSILRNLSSGYYKVKATDRNGIDTVSQAFYLVQPEEMIAATSVLNYVMCAGDSSGRAEVVVTGGTPPYTYQWTTDSNDTTTVIENLPINIYSVFVKDSRYRSEAAHKRCTAKANVNVKSPFGIGFDTVLIANPSCNGYTDGGIELNVRGGTPPYRILWENGETSARRTNLGKGTYRITVSDATDCSVWEEYALTEPEPVIVDLGADFTLCAGQELPVENLRRRDSVSCEWTDETGGVLSLDSVLTVNAAGKYRLTATDSGGCYAADEVAVKQSDDALYSDFVIPALVPRGKTIHAVNITHTMYDSAEWIIPDEAAVLERNEDSVALVFFQTGEYVVALKGYLNECRDILYKTVSVVEPSEIENYDDKEPLLKQFMVIPNPSDGNFTVNVELREAADYSLGLYGETGAILEIKEIKDKSAEETPFNRSDLGSGIYYLRFASKEKVSTFKIIIK